MSPPGGTPTIKLHSVGFGREVGTRNEECADMRPNRLQRKKKGYQLIKLWGKKGTYTTLREPTTKKSRPPQKYKKTSSTRTMIEGENLPCGGQKTAKKRTARPVEGGQNTRNLRKAFDRGHLRSERHQTCASGTLGGKRKKQNHLHVRPGSERTIYWERETTKPYNIPTGSGKRKKRHDITAQTNAVKGGKTSNERG